MNNYSKRNSVNSRRSFIVGFGAYWKPLLPWFMYASFRLRSNNNPCSTLRARNTRAPNAMGHREIIWPAGLVSLLRARLDR